MPKEVKPPHLRIAYDPDKNCGYCAWYHPDGPNGPFFKGGKCAMYNSYTVYSHETCDKREAGVPGTKGKIK